MGLMMDDAPETKVPNYPKAGSIRARVLGGLSPVVGSYARELAVELDIHPKMVARALRALIAFGFAHRVKLLETDKDYRYFLRKPGSKEVEQEQERNKQPKVRTIMLEDMDWATLTSRIMLVKNLRERLITEHHAVLNVVLGDYEQTAKVWLGDEENEDKDDGEL